MSLTPTEEAQTRQLIAQEAPLLTLAASEATIISKLGATKVNLSQLPAATTVADADLLLIRQGTTDRGVPASALKTYATSAASETVAGIVRLATDTEVAAATSRAIAVDPAGLAVSSQKSATITAVATGTADALVATFIPAITTVANQTILVRATAANATTTPTINPGSGVITLTKGANLPLAIGDISGAGHWLEITLDATLTKANLQNPATGVASRQLNFTKITTSGNFTTPANITTATVFKITSVGGGAGGGGSSNTNGIAGGGGAGGAVTFYISGLSASTSYAVVIGAAGSAGANTGTSGGTGGTTQITIGGIVYSVTGGTAGVGTTSTTGVNTTPLQGVASASISALPNTFIYQTNSTATFNSGNFIGCNGAGLPFGTSGLGSRSGAASTGGSGFGVGGGGGGSIDDGGVGAPGLFIAEWVA